MPTDKWEERYVDGDRWLRHRFYCPACGDWQTYGRTKFCPNCGENMQVKKKEETK